MSRQSDMNGTEAASGSVWNRERCGGLTILNLPVDGECSAGPVPVDPTCIDVTETPVAADASGKFGISATDFLRHPVPVGGGSRFTKPVYRIEPTMRAVRRTADTGVVERASIAGQDAHWRTKTRADLVEHSRGLGDVAPQCFGGQRVLASASATGGIAVAGKKKLRRREMPQPEASDEGLVTCHVEAGTFQPAENWGEHAGIGFQVAPKT